MRIRMNGFCHDYLDRPKKPVPRIDATLKQGDKNSGFELTPPHPSAVFPCLVC